MAGFYERLGTRAGASDEQVRSGYHQALARLVKKLRVARTQGADTAVIEAHRDELREAFEVLTDAARRRRYDLMLRLDLEGLPHGAEELWDRVEGGLVDPSAAAAVEVVRAVTSLDLGEPFTPMEEERTEPVNHRSVPAPVPQLPPRPRAVSLLTQDERVPAKIQNFGRSFYVFSEIFYYEVLVCYIRIFHLILKFNFL